MRQHILILIAIFFTPLHAASPTKEATIVHGIIISTHGGGQDWGRDEMVPTLRDIKQLGANWVVIHPYAGISADGTINRQRRFDDDATPTYWTRPIKEAHAQGLNICITPHLAYWRSGFKWAGDIEFQTKEEWAQFWTTYREWILTLAQACNEADAFVIGTELDKTLGHEKEWRALIADLRKIFKGPITYGANWTDYQRVPFWDALDVIGIQAYFPLTKKENPTEKDIQSGWQNVIKEIRAYSISQNRNIVFTELGYNQSYITAAEPWNYRVDDDGAKPLQETCWRVAFNAIQSEPRIVGAFLWKWFPYPRPIGRDFQLATPNIMSIIANAWSGDVPKVEIDYEAIERWQRERHQRRRPQEQ